MIIFYHTPAAEAGGGRTLRLDRKGKVVVVDPY